ncbi:COX15/CtaA family protein [Mucilaginibacter sp. OK098]|uniref:COX15/CtaA family protein n=1 Tax=Mucilaginibacter sp. OK098 TaxID=1855297 RepID=UPI000919FCC5|nr:COX15/CtaA family protein [Mucilaginibacter sp. OK098]SHN20256.1 cytochrome c oxidase assembly protein subunit 15 [Mucilaginibacter sp. OK098]
MRTSTSKIRFQKINLATIILLFILILAGGVVRSTGSGMGCPDWPKCFGRYIPPTSSSELPKDYKQKYVAGRLAKNQRFAKTLDVFGYSDLAKRIRQDRSILVPEEFNVAKTWTEYINRLLGAVSGIFLLLTAILAFSYRSENKLIPVLSVLNVILVGFQGWLGSIVVSTNLVAWIVTVHMLLALAILALSIITYHLARVYGRPKLSVNPVTHIATLLALVISIVQIAFGSEVREKIDAVAGHLQGGYRDDWISNAGVIFTQHRDVAILVLVANIVLYALMRRTFNRHSIQQQIMSFVFLMIMLQIVTGILLSYWALPPVAQAAHVLLATLVFSAQFYLMLNLYQSVKGGVQQ